MLSAICSTFHQTATQIQEVITILNHKHFAEIHLKMDQYKTKKIQKSHRIKKRTDFLMMALTKGTEQLHNTESAKALHAQSGRLRNEIKLGQ